jgi:hypothetical protein
MNFKSRSCRLLIYFSGTASRYILSEESGQYGLMAHLSEGHSLDLRVLIASHDQAIYDDIEEEEKIVDDLDKEGKVKAATFSESVDIVYDIADENCADSRPRMRDIQKTYIWNLRQISGGDPEELIMMN